MLRTYIALTLAIASLLAYTTTPSLAHSRPVRFDPAPGLILESSPTRVTGWFSSDIRRDANSFIQVIDEKGNRVDTGAVELATDRRQMAVQVRSGLGTGRYLVYWSTFDDGDGEVFSGCHTYFVGQAAADAAVAAGVPLDGGGACPASISSGQSASVEVSVPAEIKGRDVPIQITPTNFTLRDPVGSGQVPNTGHYHIYIDKVPTDVFTGHTHDENTAHESEQTGGLVENPVMWFRNSYTLDNLSPGTHTVTVVLFYDDHTPLLPPVMDTVTFRVPGAAGSETPLWLWLVIGIGGTLIGAGGMSIARKKKENDPAQPAS